MKFSVTKHFKVFLIIALSVIVVGMVMFGIFGFNSTVEAKQGYEVTVYVNQYTPTGNTKDITKEAVEGYFKEKEITPSLLSQKKEGVGLVLIYKFTDDVTEKCADLESTVQSALNEKAEIKGLNVDTEVNEVVATFNYDFGWIIFAMGITVLAFFVYLLFMEKFASAVSVVAISVLSAILYVALMNIMRVPINSTGSVVLVIAFVLATILATVMVGRFREISKLYENLPVADVVNKGAQDSCRRFIFTGGIVLIIAILFIIIGPVYLRFLGLQLLIADVVSLFSSYAFTPIIYSAIKKSPKK